MTKTMTRGKIRIILYVLSVIVVLGVFTIINTTRAKAYEHQYLIQQERSISELSEYISNLQTDLQKGVYSNTPPMLASLATQLLRDAGGAKSSLSQINIAGIKLGNTYKFLSQVGNFTTTLSRNVADGKEINEGQRKQLIDLLNYATVISDSITDLRENIDSGKIDVHQITSLDIDKNNPDTPVEAASLAESFNNIEQTLVDYPTLIYDGPFSDHILNKDSVFLKGKKEITRDDAMKLAQKYCKDNPQTFTKITEENGDMKSFVFANDNTTVAITKQGGYLCYILGNESGNKKKIEENDAVKKAQDYLNSIGIKNMVTSYYNTQNGICTINFAYKTQDVICYTDLIKVSVSLTNGKVISYDARGYLMNHKDRKFSKPKISKEKAKNSLSHALKVNDVRLANIPTQGAKEAYCYEFKCKGLKDDDVLVYVNTSTADEEQIMLLIYGDNGTLTK